MFLFLTIFFKLIPLYFMIFLGYIAGKNLQVEKSSVGKLLIYIISPIVIFYGTYTAPLELEYFMLPALFFIIASIIALSFYYGVGYFYKDTRTNILAFTAGTGNTGYFGLPVISAVLWEGAFSIAVLSILGIVLYENTVGFYLTAKGNFSTRESLMKVMRLPTIYAFLFWIICNVSWIEFSEILSNMILQFKWAYTILGMMIIGMGLVWAGWKSIDLWFIGWTFLAKFIIWPILIFGIISLDTSLFHIFAPEVHKVLILMSIVPLAANTVAIATELKTYPEKASVAVLMSTLFALFFIPLVVSFL